MSSSFRNGRAAPLMLAAGLAATGAAQAADVYFQPQLEAATEYHTNRDLVPDEENSLRDQKVIGFRADVGANWGIRTQRSDTRLRPTLRLQEVPDRDDLARLTGSLALQNTYRWQRSQWNVVGSFTREDASRAQLIDAGYDDFDPDDPIVDGATRVVVSSEKMDRLQVRPSFTHSINQKLDFETEGLWYNTKRDSRDPARDMDADARGLSAGLRWKAQPRTAAGVGAYYAEYEARHNLNNTKGVGVSFDVEHAWTPVLSGVLSLDAERTDVESSILGGSGTFTSLAPSAEIIRKGEISEWRLFAGRTFSPTSYGTRSNIDQVRVELRRGLSPLVDLRLAARGIRMRAQGDDFTSPSDRDYARGDVELNWRLSRTMYVRGSYSYVYQEYKDDVGAAKGHILLLGFGYRGLAPPRR